MYVRTPRWLTRLAGALLLVVLSATAAMAQAAVESALLGVFSRLPAGEKAEVIVTFHGSAPAGAADLDLLRAVGIVGGITFRSLPMVGTLATLEQVNALARSPRVRSVYWNREIELYNHDATHLTGARRVWGDGGMKARNGGSSVTGSGVTVLVNDSGIDGTHPDLPFGSKVVQNALALADRNLLGVAGFEYLVVVEDQPITDYANGHGTHVAGTVAGTGAASAGRHAGAAPGANLVGYGIGNPRVRLTALGGFDYALSNQGRYGIRVITNSWGSAGAFEPDDPINVATRIAAEERNIVVTFAAGNSGPGLDTHNPYAKAPWVVSVANGWKDGRLEPGSSRGTPGGPRTVTAADGEVITWLDEPTVTAPGTGIVSARSKATNPGTDVYYTTMSGTSMATPHVAGIVALMLDANPLLTPAEVKQILKETATRMPGQHSYEVGAGFVNAYAAVQKALDLATPFGATQRVERIPTTRRDDVLARKTFDYTPGAPEGTYKTAFTVAPGAAILEARIDFEGVDLPVYGGAGNFLSLDVYDPQGNRYYAYDLYFALYGTNKLGVVVNNPMPGQWTAEVKHFTLLGTEGNFIGSLPDRVTKTITLTFFDTPQLADVPTDHPARGAIEFALSNGYLGLCAGSSFCPGDPIRRADFARSFTQFGAIRQYLPLGGGSTFGDVSPADRPFVEAVAARGAALRDREFRYAGVMEGNGATFGPDGGISRAEVAKMLVRGVGGEEAALAHTGDVTVIYNGQPHRVADQSQIPAALRGYVHVAINSNMLNVHWAVEQGPYDLQPVLKPYFRPASALTRADAAVAMSRYYAQYFK